MTAPGLGYLGWHSRGNVGDDAIHDGVIASMPGVSIVDIPLYPRDFVKGLGNLKRLGASIPFLGGGTCVGRRNWRLHVIGGLTMARCRPAAAVGVGVEDPAFAGRHSFSDRGELAHWRKVLRRFDGVSVRGPRSAELLADIGVQARVVGDPALALGRPCELPDMGLVGVNLGFGDDLWGHDPDAVVSATSAMCTELAQRGYRVVGLAINPGDVQLLRRMLGRAGLPPTVEAPASASLFAAAAARCNVIVAMRLHAAILAALAGVPSVQLEYQPKCRDFARSIGGEQHLLRTDRLTSSGLVAGTLGLIENRDTEAARVTTMVDALRASLREEFVTLKGRLDNFS